MSAAASHCAGAPLLADTVLESVPGERAGARRDGALPAALGAGALPASLVLGFMAEVAGRVHPDRVLIAASAVRLVPGTPGRALTARAEVQWEGRVGVVLEEDGRPVAEGSLTFEPAYPCAPAPEPLAPVPPALLEDAALFAGDGREWAPAAPRALHGLEWVRLTGLGRLCAGLTPPALPLGSAGSPGLPGTPVLLENLVQLARWAWYALAGEGAEPAHLGRARWYRAPRPGERLVAQAHLTGSRGGQPLVHCEARAADGSLLVELSALALAPRPLPHPPRPPRRDWQTFLRLVEGRAP